MIILAIESSGTVASAALLKDNNTILEKTGPFKVTHSETLMPMIEEAFKEADMKPEDIDLIAVSGGPGSFTGLRIGSATAKGLGFALNKELVHVPTLDGMAYNCEGTDSIVVPMMDARRKQVYTGAYTFDKGQMQVILPGCAMAAEDLMEYINDHFEGRQIIFLGDGVDAYREMVEEKCRIAFTFAEGADALQRASSVGRLGYVMAQNGQTVSADAEAPVYLRPSQAERVRAEQAGQ